MGRSASVATSARGSVAASSNPSCGAQRHEDGHAALGADEASHFSCTQRPRSRLVVVIMASAGRM
jgi:hypothetical protein